MSQIDLLWIIISACFVFFMQAGFVCFEVGFVSPKNMVSVAIENIITFAVCTLVFFMWGYGLMFGPTFHHLFGIGHWFLLDLTQTPDIAQSAFVFFQLMFAGTSVTIFSGSMSERTHLKALIVAAVAMAGLVYPLYGHWVWSGVQSPFVPWLQKLGFVDFAGATVVHATSGWFALAGAYIVGPRTGRFDVAGKIHNLGRSNIPFAVLGTFILWFSWFGFNGGSLLKANAHIGLILLNTNFAAAAGVFGALLTTKLFIYDHSYMDAIFSGVLGGLVAITAGSNLLTPFQSIILGLTAGSVVVLSASFLERLGIDDAVGAVSIHAFGGATGTILLALLAAPDKLPAGSRFIQLLIQTGGVLINFTWSFGLGLLIFYLIKHSIGLRVSPEQERMGLNVVEYEDIYSWADYLKTTSFENITEYLNAKVHEQNLVLKKQAQLLTATQEQERTKIGRDLHDGVGQFLAAAKFQLGLLKNDPAGDQVPKLQDNLSKSITLIDSAIQEMRGVLTNLRPVMLQELGLEKTIEYLLLSLKASSGIEAKLTKAGVMPRWENPVELNIFRIVQEATTNVIKHSAATILTIKISPCFNPLGKTYSFEIIDNGSGFDRQSPTSGIGLVSMTERAAMIGGTLTLRSSPGAGTTLILEVPIEKD